MAQITISDEIFNRIMAFKPLVESVLEVSLEQEAYVELLLRLTPDYLMKEFFGAAEAPALLNLLQQIGQASPEVYGTLAQVLERDEVQALEARKRAQVKQTLGFPEPEK